MDGFLKMSSKDRRLACLQVEERMHLQAASVEKDFWICWTLRELFALPGIGPHLTFKAALHFPKRGNSSSVSLKTLISLWTNRRWVLPVTLLPTRLRAKSNASSASKP